MTTALISRALGVLYKDILFYVISHERSGTHFAINTIVRNTNIRTGFHNIGEWFGPYDKDDDRFTHIEWFNQAWEGKEKCAAVIKSHCDRDLYDAKYRKAKVIYVLRDPRDTLTSWFHYLNREEYYRNNPQVSDHRCETFTEFLRRPVSPFMKYSYSLHGDFSNVVERWAHHVRGWSDTTNTLSVRYEDLLLDCTTVLNRISEFLDVRVKRKTHQVGLYDAPSILPRKGIVGDWKNIFTKSDEQFVRETLGQVDIRWDDVVYRSS